MKTIGEIKKQSLQILKGNWGRLAILNLMVLLVALVLYIPYYGIFFHMKDEIAETRSIFPSMFYCWGIILVLMLIIPVFNLAVLQEIANLVKNGTKPSLEGMFKNFRLAGKAIGGFWWRYLWIYLWTLAYAAPFFILVIATTILSKPEFYISPVVVVILGVCAFIYYIVMIVLIIRKSLSYSMLYCAIVDDNSKGPVSGLKASKKVTKRKLGKIFCFGLSFIGWLLLNLLTLGIGTLWLSSYMETSMFLMYKELSADSQPANPVQSQAPSTESSL